LSGHEEYPAVQWTTPVDKRLNYHHQDFYVDGKKIVKRSVLNRLTVLGLALWFLDDGSIKRNEDKFEGVRLHTNGFDKRSLDIIINWFSRYAWV